MNTLLSLILAGSVALSGDVGVWDLKVDNSTIFRFEIEDTPKGKEAVWERPEHFRFDGDTFSEVSGPVVQRKAMSVKAIGDELEMSFEDPRPLSRPDVFHFQIIDADHARVTYEGMEPFDLVRTGSNDAQLGPWDAMHDYTRVVVRPTNAEMTAIFNADQGDRRGPNIDWSKVRPADSRRLTRTKELLAGGALQSGDDFEHAAFVFQHGSKPDDFLQAHLLAMIAVARGKPEAIWIASATLDRYLCNIGKPQVLGTQYSLPSDGGVTQEPYDRTLVSDAMRRALHVPTLAEQEQERQRMLENRSTEKKK
ncbi:hypothetical protein [Novosphingobium beihaiensis]|uniref:Uncharacterized protein n=1 Tax=Novosphingobium beihaiensis TaxID=2930389 RepID=A0ABT0BJY0_9SPHN|nr:hypothetical protein [Novosphingobium beihaiensis]MCJ2185350.1 hypothetical protein [Novosphingobium beihaiensis]